ncbi:MAG TPA: DegT/DnrJ/EryC1/StrS family aminotransferase, partial [Candidatus Eremiobacteraeota bacterium]|nr:DegT/DnrJ/EryC1/StrS family aminotransferase [Candidatus Eremiobacteraeota bacterium]
MSGKLFFFDLKNQYLQIRDEIESVLKHVCEDTAFSGGSYVAKFEKNFASFCGVNFAAGLNSGTSALHLSLLALGIKGGDEVIVPANTFIATAWAVSYVNAIPVFVDCSQDTWN